MKIKTTTVAFATIVAGIMAASSAAAVTYDIKDGKLMAIREIYGSPANRDWSTAPVIYTNPNSGQKFYYLTDIEFIDGTCNDVFGKCTRMSSYSASGFTAVDPLFSLFKNDIYIDGVQYDLSSNPQLINGCDSKINCSIFAGYSTSDGGVVGKKFIIDAASDERGEMILKIDPNADTANSDNTTFGRYTSYTRLVAAVPEPATWAMMLVGFGMIGGAARYRRKNTALRYS